MSDVEPDLHAWTIEGVHGVVTLAVNGEVVMIHTSDERNTIVYVDELYARLSEGQPTELTREQARQLAELILSAVDT